MSFAPDLPPKEPGAPDDSGALLRLMQLVLAGVDASGSDGCRLTRDSAIVSVARALVGEATDWTAASRTATMALRDLVWRPIAPERDFGTPFGTPLGRMHGLRHGGFDGARGK